MADDPDVSGHTDRRRFLLGASAAAVTGTLGACAADGDDAEAAVTAVADETPTADADASLVSIAEPPTSAQEAPVAFRTARQLAVTGPVTAAGAVASFDVLVTDRDALAVTLQRLSAEVERLMGGSPPEPADAVRPPTDSGALLDADTAGAGLRIGVGVGASLFDNRFGLAEQRPSELIPMPRFRNDRLVDPALSGGDIVVTISSPSRQATAHALHQIVRVTDRRLRLRWAQEGFNELLPESVGAVAHTRNLMGFRDGTSNLDTDDTDVMNEFVFVQSSDDEPDWATNGTYLAVRVIRMLVEFWATAALVRQEQIFGRHRATGAPLGQESEDETPSFEDDPGDSSVPMRSHIRLANPRRGNDARILRRGFSYLNGAAADGTLDQGLLFNSYQRSMSRGFIEVQARLDGEPLEDYVKPVGGGFFYLLPGPGTGADGWLGESLLA